MGKGRTSLNCSLPFGLYIWVKENIDNPSYEVQKYFMQRKHTMDSPEMQDHRALLDRINKVKAERDEAQRTMAILQVELEAVEAKIAAQQEKEAKRRAEAEAKAKICDCCGVEISQNVKSHKFGNIKVCNGCFVTGNANQIIKEAMASNTKR